MITGRPDLMNRQIAFSVWKPGNLKGRTVVLIIKNSRTIYRSIGTLAGLLLCLAAMVAEAGNLYRYRNSEGNLVIDHQIPPQYIDKGYEVITSTGRVEKVVPPRAESDPEDETSSTRAQAVEADQREEDQMLLRSYSSLEELRAAAERRLEQLDREIDIVESNLEKNRRQLKEFQRRAAMQQFSGKAVSETILESMDDVLEAQRNAEEMLVLRRTERRQMASRYERYAERFAGERVR